MIFSPGPNSGTVSFWAWWESACFASQARQGRLLILATQLVYVAVVARVADHTESELLIPVVSGGALILAGLVLLIVPARVEYRRVSAAIGIGKSDERMSRGIARVPGRVKTQGIERTPIQ